MAAIQKRRNSLPFSIFELQQIKKFRLTFGPWYQLVFSCRLIQQKTQISKIAGSYIYFLTNVKNWGMYQSSLKPTLDTQVLHTITQRPECTIITSARTMRAEHLSQSAWKIVCSEPPRKMLHTHYTKPPCHSIYIYKDSKLLVDFV